MRAEVKRDGGGTWYARPYLGRGADGRAIRPYRSFPGAATREEAQALADSWAASLTAHGRVASALLPDLLEDYVGMREANGASPNSVRTWRLFCRYVRAHMPAAVASEVGVTDLNRLERRLLAPKSEGGQGLSRNSVLGVHHFLRGAFRHLVDAGVVASSPMPYVAKPSPERHEAAALDEWDFAEVDRALSRALASALGAGDLGRAARALAASLALRTGMRVGEVCALRRRDVRRAAGALHVGGTVVEQAGRAPWRRDSTKGRRPRNVSVTPDVIADIAEAEAAQDAALGHLGADAPVVTEDGSLMRPTAVSASFTGLRRSLGLPAGLTFHSLRHTHATWLLAAGVDLKTLSERLGHADEATTLRIYAHVMPGRDAAAAEAFARAADAAAGVPAACQRAGSGPAAVRGETAGGNGGGAAPGTARGR